jgi:hypothetical protein
VFSYAPARISAAFAKAGRFEGRLNNPIIE